MWFQILLFTYTCVAYFIGKKLIIACFTLDDTHRKYRDWMSEYRVVWKLKSHMHDFRFNELQGKVNMGAIDHDKFMELANKDLDAYKNTMNDLIELRKKTSPWNNSS